MENSDNSLNYQNVKMIGSKLLRVTDSAEDKSNVENKAYQKKYLESKYITYKKVLKQMQTTYSKLVSGSDSFSNDDMLGIGSILVVISLLLMILVTLHKI
jgi:hypothetical protein